MGETRTVKSIRNASVGIAAQLITVILNFGIRTVLVWSLGSYYLGLNSVMTSLVAVFSLAELGLGNAIAYSLYRPLSGKDRRKIEAYLALFKRLYRIIGLTIIVLGSAFIPFLPNVINTEVTIEVLMAYVLFVSNAALSYFLFTYRTTLIQANQEKYLVTFSELIYAIISVILQVFFFAAMHNFILGIASLILAQMGKSAFIVVVCKKKYPTVNFSSKEKLSKDEKRELGRNVYAMTLGRFSDTASNNVPVLVVSSLIGLIQSGLYSNYQMVSSAVTTLLSQVSGSATASVGNLNVEEGTEAKETVFQRLSFVSFCGYTVSAACVYAGINPFIIAWLGEDYCLSSVCAFALAFNLLTIGILQSTVAFKDGCGIFFQGRFRPVVSCLLTIVFSIAFAMPFGVEGVMFAPALSRLLTAGWYDPWLVHKYVLHKSPARFYLKNTGYLVLGIAICFLVGRTSSIFPGDSWILFIEIVIFAAITTTAIIALMFHRSQSFVWLCVVLKGFLKKNNR